MIIRPATLDDLERLMFLEHVIFPDDSWSVEQMAAGILSVYGHYVVAERDDTVVGYAGAFHLTDDDVAEIHTIAVDTDARGVGLGAILMDDLIDWSRRDGASRIVLEVRADNPVAQRLYESRDFRVIATRAGYYQPANVDALVMEKVMSE